MGFFKDLSTLKHQARELGDQSDPGARLAEMGTKLGALNESMAMQAAVLAAPPGDAIVGSVQIVSVTPTRSSVSGSAVVDLSVLLVAPGRPPIPATSSAIVPLAYLYLVQVGTTLPAHLSAADPTAFVIDWATASMPA